MNLIISVMSLQCRAAEHAILCFAMCHLSYKLKSVSHFFVSGYVVISVKDIIVSFVFIFFYFQQSYAIEQINNTNNNNSKSTLGPLLSSVSKKDTHSE